MRLEGLEGSGRVYRGCTRERVRSSSREGVAGFKSKKRKMGRARTITGAREGSRVILGMSGIAWNPVVRDDLAKQHISWRSGTQSETGSWQSRAANDGRQLDGLAMARAHLDLCCRRWDAGQRQGWHASDGGHHVIGLVLSMPITV